MADNFVPAPPLYVVIPYSEYEKMVKLVQNVSAIEEDNRLLHAQYDAMHGLFLECMEKIRDVERSVTD